MWPTKEKRLYVWLFTSKALDVVSNLNISTWDLDLVQLIKSYRNALVKQSSICKTPLFF